MQTNDGIGYLLRDLRQRQGLSRKQVAERAQVGVRTLEYWEADTHSPRILELEVVLTVLGATAHERTRILAHLTTPRGLRLYEQELKSKTQGLHDPIPNLGDLLRTMRLRQGLTQEGLAAALGVTRLTIKRWELGEHFPEDEILDRACRLLCAAPQEHAALLARRLMLPSLSVDIATQYDSSTAPVTFDETAKETAEGISRETSFEECQKRFHFLTATLASGWSPLTDLAVLSLERHLRLLLRSSPPALSLLVELNYAYARWLHFQGRISEAQSILRRANNAAIANRTPTLFLPERLNLEASQTWYRSRKMQKVFDFMRLSVQGVQHHLTQDTAGFTVYCDLALFCAKLEQADGMHYWLSVARQTLHPTHTERAEENRYYRISFARSLMALGKPVEAMEWLPPIPSDNGSYSALMALFIWSEALIVAGEKHAAEPLMTRLAALIARQRMPTMHVRWQALARRL